MTITHSDPPRDANRPTDSTGPSNFIEDMVREDLRTGVHGGRVATRFPPEPNGYLHIGHAKSICLNFGVAALAGEKGTCNLRFDDTNPSTETVEFVESIKRDVHWMGFEWNGPVRHASDYFEALYDAAAKMIEAGKAYVDSQTTEQIRATRGSFYEKGTDSPYRNRSAAESLDLFRRMRAGEFADGQHVLRAKIDMASPDLNLRDPLMYRIRKVPHYRTGSAWSIYPMYDYAHPISDAIEGITHSLCTLEFEAHRPLYDWFVAAAGYTQDPPRQTEFARLNLAYTMLSKRRLQELVGRKLVRGWDDPRMPTLAGLRRRGVTPDALRSFCGQIGVSKRDGLVDIALFEYAIRENLNATSPRVMAVLRPLKVVIENWPEGHVEHFDAPYNAEDASWGSRKVPFSRELFIERDDFMENPPKKFFRLAPGREVRLRNACIIKCERVVKNDAGDVIEVRCTWDPNSRGGAAADGRKIKSTMHWVSAQHAIEAEVRMYDRLFTVENPSDEKHGEDWTKLINPKSEEVLVGARVEPSLADALPGKRVQFERLGYFCVDTDSTRDRPVFNQTIALRDTWAKVQKNQGEE